MNTLHKIYNESSFEEEIKDSYEKELEPVKNVFNEKSQQKKLFDDAVKILEIYNKLIPL
mgnify:CR=1 FL=1